MLNVFRHSGFEMSSTTEYGTVTLRFGIGLTEAYRVAPPHAEIRRGK